MRKKQTLEDICKAFEKYWNNKDTETLFFIRDIHKVAKKYKLNKLKPSAKQILGFSRMLSKIINKKRDSILEDDVISYFLSALIYSSPDKELKIDLTKLNKNEYIIPLEIEQKKVYIKGNCWIESHNSSITVDGSCLLNHIYNSKISVNGEADLIFVDNSRIYINGKVADLIYVSNSEIYINGNFKGDVHRVKGSKIYIKGNLEIMPSGLQRGTEIYRWKNDKWEKFYVVVEDSISLEMEKIEKNFSHNSHSSPLFYKFYKTVINKIINRIQKK